MKNLRMRPTATLTSLALLCAVLVACGGGAGDTDADGLTDSVELALGTDPTDSDTDNDGVADGREHADETDPLDAASHHAMATETMEGVDESSAEHAEATEQDPHADHAAGGAASTAHETATAGAGEDPNHEQATDAEHAGHETVTEPTDDAEPAHEEALPAEHEEVAVEHEEVPTEHEEAATEGTAEVADAHDVDAGVAPHH